MDLIKTKKPQHKNLHAIQSPSPTIFPDAPSGISPN